MMANPAASRNEAFRHFMSEIKSDPDWVEVLAKDYFDRTANSWMPRRTDLGYVFGRSAKYIEQRKALERQTQDSVRRVTNSILMDLTLPNGKMLRYATGAECVKAGGFYLEVAKHVKSTQVVDKHLTEDDLKNIQLRFVAQKTKEPA